MKKSFALKAAALMLTVVLMILAAACQSNELAGKRPAEKELNEGAFVLVRGIQTDLYRGDLAVLCDLPGYEIEASCDNGDLHTDGRDPSDGEQSGKTIRFKADDVFGFTACSSGSGEEGAYGHIGADNITIRMILRKDNRIVGYGVIASWGNDGQWSFVNNRLIKAVELFDENGEPAAVTEEEVNRLIDETVKEQIEKPGLFTAGA